MPYIQNVAWVDVQNGDHKDPGDNAVLIQIVDPAANFPVPKHKFEKVFQFEFSDVDESTKDKELFESFRMSQSQAQEIVAILEEALEQRSNVVVHCVAGQCRSGAVAEVGIMMGFSDTNRYRSPNTWVKKLLMKELGWTYE